MLLLRTCKRREFFERTGLKLHSAIFSAMGSAQIHTIALLGLLAASASAVAGFNAADWTFRAELDGDNRFWLYWNVDEARNATRTTPRLYLAHRDFQAAKSITFAARAKTNGWVGLGISTTSKMPFSDFVMAWVGPRPMHAPRTLSPAIELDAWVCR